MIRNSLILFLVVGLLVAPGTAAAVKDPQFKVYVPDPTLVPGQQTQLTVQLVNDAPKPDDRVKQAHNVRVSASSGKTPIEVKSGTMVLGTMADGAPRQVTFRISVPRNISAGDYRIPIHVRYEFNGDENGSDTAYATVHVDPRARFRVVDTSSDAPVGDTGTVTLKVRNVGERAATDATATLKSTSADVAFGKSGSASRFVGQWAPGETRTVQYKVSVAPNAERRQYALQLSVAYDDENGTARQSPPVSTGMTPLRAQSFSLDGITSDLRAGRDGTVTGTITNHGPKTAHDAVVVFATQQPNVHPLETEYAIGDLAPNQSTTFSLPVEVSDSARAGPRQFAYRLRYRNADDEQRQSDPLTAKVAVAPKRDRFTVEPKAATVTAGGSASVTLVVTNNGNETLRNVNAKAFVDDPLSASDDEAFVSKLDPGQSAEITFAVSASGTALQKTYVLETDFQYDTPDGQTKLSETYQVPVDVTVPKDSGGVPATMIVGGLVVVGVALVGGWLWLRR